MSLLKEYIQDVSNPKRFYIRERARRGREYAASVGKSPQEAARDILDKSPDVGPSEENSFSEIEHTEDDRPRVFA